MSVQVYLHTGGGQFILLLLPPSQLLLSHPPRYFCSELHSGEKIRPTQGPLYRWTNLLMLRTGVSTACLHMNEHLGQKSFICRSERIPRMGDQGACCPVKQVRAVPSITFEEMCEMSVSKKVYTLKVVNTDQIYPSGKPSFKLLGYRF